MKNTVKKILALVFAVVMVCSLAVPALAAEDDITVYVKIVGRDGDVLKDEDVTLSSKNQNAEKALKDEKIGDTITVNTSTGKITAIKSVKVTNDAITGEFGTGSIVVAVNGKAVSEDLATVALEDGDKITVYWADTTLGTKLAMVDDSRLDEGIVSLYYYDAEGNRQPLKGAKISLYSSNLKTRLRDKTNQVNTVEKKDESYNYEFYFTTDEKGQIWIAPEYLDAADSWTIGYAWVNTSEGDTITYDKYYDWNGDEKQTAADDIIAKALKAVTTDDGYTAKERDYYNANLTRNVEDVEVIGYEIVVYADMYNTADATGDMTMVYVLVAAAAVITLAAVVVMKKKAVKAN